MTVTEVYYPAYWEQNGEFTTRPGVIFVTHRSKKKIQELLGESKVRVQDNPVMRFWGFGYIVARFMWVLAGYEEPLDFMRRFKPGMMVSWASSEEGDS